MSADSSSSRELSIWRRPRRFGGPLLAFLISLGLVADGSAQTPPPEATTELLVSAVDPTGMLAQLVPEGRMGGERPAFKNGRVGHSFAHPGGTGELELALHGSEEAAMRGFLRTMPQRVDYGFQDGQVEGLISFRAAHLRFRNMVLLIRFDEDVEESRRIELVEKMRQMTTEGQSLQLSTGVDTPTVRPVQLKKKTGIPIDQTAAFVLSGDTERELLFDVPASSARQLVDGKQEIWVSKHIFDSEPVLRVARPTGEVAEISLSRARAAEGVKTLTERELQPVPLKLTNASKASALERLHSGLTKNASTLAKKERQQLQEALRGLAKAPGHEDAPLFQQVLESDHDSVSKELALRGLDRALGAHGLERYRALARDGNQDLIVRRDAIRLVARYGDPSDLAWLTGLKDHPHLGVAASSAARGLVARGETPPNAIEGRRNGT